MLRTFVLLFLLFSTSLFSKSINDEYLQIVAKTLNTNDNVVHAKGDVFVYSQSFYITADKLIYDKSNLTLELFGDVSVLRDDETVNFSQYMFINLKNDSKNLKPMLLLDKKLKLWFNAQDAKSTKERFELDGATMSSCDCKDPAWSISFSSGDYSSTNQWVNTYNTRLYVNDVPVLYTPYFGFPTDKTRRTGLLKPTIGFSQNEGFLYAQPIYFAPKLNYDFEYIPQNRAKRGWGHALKYRYKDSLYSKLEIETGIFHEKEDYQQEYNLLNKKHYGWNFLYDRTKLFSNDGATDGLIIDALDMNDVDYINTKYNSNTNSYTDKFLESKIKYYYNTNRYYGDIDIRKYNDISKQNNDDTLQSLPIVNLHKYSNSLIFKDLSYSANLKASRKTRKEGLNGDITEVYIPISYHSYLFNNYLNFTFSEQINFTNVSYSNNTANYSDANYGTNNHVISLYTDLLKPYNSFIHTLNLNTTYTKPDTFQKSGDISGITSNDSNLTVFPVAQSNQSISLGLNQSLYSKESLKEIVNHKMNQLYVYNETKNKYEKNDLQNDLTLYYDYGSLSNRLLYNHNIKAITSSSTTLKFKKDDIFFNGYYNYTKDKDTLVRQKDLIYDLGFEFERFYSVSFKDEYDLTKDYSKKREYEFNIDKKCWATSFKLIDSIVASSTTTNAPLRQKTLYVEVDLKQLFQFNQSYKLKER